MSEARVESIDAIKAFRRAWLKFAEVANVALTEAEADAHETFRWLETEQRSFWANQVRKSTDLVSRCEEALRHKRIFKDAAGRTPSAVDEEKALARAKRMKETAEEKLENVRRYTPRVGREIMLFKGQIQRLATFLGADIPTAAAKLDKITDTLERYVALQGSETSPITPVAQQPTDQVSSQVQAPPAPREEP